jgi:hypothetical protein
MAKTTARAVAAQTAKILQAIRWPADVIRVFIKWFLSPAALACCRVPRLSPSQKRRERDGECGLISRNPAPDKALWG